MPVLARLVASASQLANKRGVYLGPRATKIHVALYRRSGGRIGGHVPGWPDAGFSCSTTRGRRAA
jgi:F420H(2)-dependent quinone reductase